MMKSTILYLGISVFIYPGFCIAQSSALQGFVKIAGGVFTSGDVATDNNRNLVRVEDFEILDHPVTNREYKVFVDASGYPPPLHWSDNQIPAGKEEYPVIFINRFDITAFLQWLSARDDRICRLPTKIEFEYAARGGLVDKKYPWGDGNPQGNANYDADGQRKFDRWQDFLQPAAGYEANGYGLFGMAGNVWQLTMNVLDPAVTRFKYRITDVNTCEGSRMGGSWARSAEYLRCGNAAEMSSGIRHPDVGFRPVREPPDADWHEQPRKLCAVSTEKGQVLLSWALLATDTKTTGFNVYRSDSRNHAGFLITNAPVKGTTSYYDTNVETDKRYHYYIRSLPAEGVEGRRSEWIGITVTRDSTAAIVSFRPVYKQGSLVPVFGDLDGDGTLDCVIRLSNGNNEMSQDPGIPVQLEAFTSYGRSLWRKDICTHDHCYGSANNVPFNVWDMDGDGKAEVITRLKMGDSVVVAILDGLTGQLKFKTPWPDMVTDFQRSSTRIHLSIGYLDGIHPAVITQTGLYENEVFVAYDARLNKLWQFNSFAETNGSAGHKIEVSDVDGDGRQEVFDGTTCLNHDGSLRWSVYRQHPDIVAIHDHIPDRPGLEVFYLVESNAHAGVYMVDANSGEIIWKVNREDDARWTHGHVGWNADIWDGSAGIESVSNRAGHNDRNLVLFSANGDILLEPFPTGYYPLEWNGDPTRELLSDNGHRIGKFDGKKVNDYKGIEPNQLQNSSLLMVADLYGDFRDGLVLEMPAEEGGKAIVIVTSTGHTNQAFLSPAENRDYRLWLARNMGGGYRSVYDQPLRTVQ